MVLRAFKVAGMVTRGSMHLRSGIMQNLKMSTGTQNLVSVLKVIKISEEDEYRYSRVLKVQRKMSTRTGCVSIGTQSC